MSGLEQQTKARDEAVAARRRGRPTLYRPEHCALARQHCQQGASNDKLAGLLGAAPRSVDNWIARIPAFAAAVREGRAAAEAEAMRALYQRAVGHKQRVERIVRCGDGYTSVFYTRHYLPDTRACKRWLCKRRPQNWRNNPHAPLARPVRLPSAAPSSPVPAAHQFTVMDDALVANALYERAVGYRQPVERVIVRAGVPRLIRYTRHHPPHTAACIFWLINRRPQNWSLGCRSPAATGASRPKSTAHRAHKLAADQSAGQPARHSSASMILGAPKAGPERSRRDLMLAASGDEVLRHGQDDKKSGARSVMSLLPRLPLCIESSQLAAHAGAGGGERGLVGSPGLAFAVGAARDGPSGRSGENVA